MDKAYVSEFTLFMNRYLEQHPEVIEDQLRGWRFGWEQEVEPEAQRNAELDIAPDDAYGFNWFTWRHKPHLLKVH